MLPYLSQSSAVRRSPTLWLKGYFGLEDVNRGALRNFKKKERERAKAAEYNFSSQQSDLTFARAVQLLNGRVLKWAEKVIHQSEYIPSGRTLNLSGVAPNVPLAPGEWKNVGKAQSIDGIVSIYTHRGETPPVGVSFGAPVSSKTPPTLINTRRLRH